MATIPLRRSTATSPNAARSCRIVPRFVASSSVTETETSDVVTTSTEVRWVSNTSNTRRRKPGANSMREERNLTSVVPRLPAIARTGRRGASNAIIVPFPSGLRELNTNTGMPRCTAGAIVAGCSTFAPNAANSAASSKLMRSMSCAPGTTRGSAVSMPSTSVQISMAVAPMAAPISEAV